MPDGAKPLSERWIGWTFKSASRHCGPRHAERVGTAVPAHAGNASVGFAEDLVDLAARRVKDVDDALLLFVTGGVRSLGHRAE